VFRRSQSPAQHALHLCEPLVIRLQCRYARSGTVGLRGGGSTRPSPFNESILALSVAGGAHLYRGGKQGIILVNGALEQVNGVLQHMFGTKSIPAMAADIAKQRKGNPLWDPDAVLPYLEKELGIAPAAAAQSHAPIANATNNGPVPVHVAGGSVAITNGKDLASGVTGAQASALNRPNNGVAGHNVQLDPFGPVAQPAPY
jgi:hypothetical protein